ncbi:substrate-binding periplasmic protein [Marinobacter sp. X15-166B]|uniref:substrate-binding periplasmic protein n=1 Tax=Marinobacter sp. X15-166B TaxID=1897620 RepID=UPI00085C2C19|nr:transporter substrate-binding domain-containing protein [Marinobacter sp. X15-166B]OEY66085.1 amino acid ABC transporter substrate-binding protein [Marinobacter sp. X15-166B]
MGFVLPLLLAVLTVVNPAAAVASEKLYVYTENFPPYNMSTQGREYEHGRDSIDGICAEMVKALFAHTGFDYAMKLRNWDYGYNRAKNRANHGIFCTTYTDSRASEFKWVGPLTQNLWTIFAPAGSTFTMDTLEDARGKTIGGFRNDVMTEFLLERGYTVSALESDDLNPKRLELGQIDLWISDGLAGPYFAAQQNVEGLVPVYSFNDVDLYLAMSLETSDDVVNTLNRALNTIKTTGMYDAIGTKYGL